MYFPLQFSNDPCLSFMLLIMTLVLCGMPALDNATYNCPIEGSTIRSHRIVAALSVSFSTVTQLSAIRYEVPYLLYLVSVKEERSCFLNFLLFFFHVFDFGLQLESDDPIDR